MQNNLEELLKENSRLRVLLAKSNLPCVYCGKKEMSQCPSGFPGCGRMDDLMADPAASNDPSEGLQELTADGYPTEWLLNRIRSWHYSEGGFERLLRYIPSVWRYGADYFKVPTHPSESYIVSTGGWSGNEDIIEALQQNIMFWNVCWQNSSAGGHYVFRVPPAFRIRAK
jgi:hypothetical protein